jgi:hypothetical protein
MSYLLYINGLEVELKGVVSIPLNKQANDINNITTRNSNFTQSIKLEKTARNVRIFENSSLVGNQSDFPYKKNRADLIDADTGEHLIYDGWAVLLESTENEYVLTIYDGSIDFYRAIENITITDCGISALNHIKSIANIIDTWTDEEKPYRYIIADYNGKNEFDGKLNIDYQVPSASVEFIWQRVFDFIGFTYEGSIFSNEKFKDLWLTFPKPTGEVEPNEILINSQTSSEQPYTAWYYNGNALLQETRYNIDLFRENFASAYANLLNTNLVVPDVSTPIEWTSPVFSSIQILQQGTYSFNLTGAEGITFRLQVFTALNEVIINNTFQNSVIFNANQGDIVRVLAVVTTGANQLTPIGLDGVSVDFNFIDGYAVNFEEIFIDFKVSDFIREIVIRFGLTPYKDKYRNHIRFLTLNELLQNEEIDNWKDKFNRKLSEKYTFGNYAKRNNFKYRYNDDGGNFFDGFIEIENENLPEEVNLFQSRIYAPETQQRFMVNDNYRVYKIWEREIKDDETVNYKDLDNRFYFQRSEKRILNIQLISELTATEADSYFFFKESYFRIGFNECINDFYSSIKTIFDKSKLVTIEAYLKPVEFASLDLSRLIYIPQLSSYYLINRASNFVKNKPTKIELIEVDYITPIDDQTITPVTPIVNIADVNVVDCELVFDLATDLAQPTEVELLVYTYQADVTATFYWQPLQVEPRIFGTLSGNQVSFDLSQLPFNPFGYKFAIRKILDTFIIVVSEVTDVIMLDGTCYTVTPLPTEVTIIRAVNLGVVSSFPFTYQNISLTYDYDELPAGATFYQVNLFYFATEFGGYASGGTFFKSVTDPKEITALVGSGSLTITKVKISILGVESNEFTL